MLAVALRQTHSHVIPTEVEGPRKCGTRHASRRGVLRLRSGWQPL